MGYLVFKCKGGFRALECTSDGKQIARLRRSVNRSFTGGRYHPSLPPGLAVKITGRKDHGGCEA